MKVCFIGGGKMAQAIIAAAINSDLVEGSDIGVCDVSASRRHVMSRRYGVVVSSKPNDLFSQAPLVFLAVKPQDLDAVCEEITGRKKRKPLVVSIAAGKRIKGIESLLPNAKIVRVMPNLPAQVECGMSVFCAGKGVTARDRSTVVKWLSCFGKVLELPEKHLDAVTALSGSGPAFFAYYLEMMSEAGVELGLQKSDAELMAAQTMLGAAELVLKGGMTADGLVKAVCTKKGTTEAGMAVLCKAPFQKVLKQTLKAAAERSKQLSR